MVRYKLLARFWMTALVLEVGCSGGDDEGSSGSGATCASTCEKSIALGCPAGEHDQAACEASCADQASSCDSAGFSAQFQTYLDCVESTPMECGSATSSPSSPQCLQQGLALIACAAGVGNGGSGGGVSGGGMGMTGDPCAHDTDCLGLRRCKSGVCEGVMTCINDGSCGGGVLSCFSDPEAGNMCWYSCTSDADCASTGYVDWPVCTDGWCSQN